MVSRLDAILVPGVSGRDNAPGILGSTLCGLSAILPGAHHRDKA
jgi:hypothetical protein